MLKKLYILIFLSFFPVFNLNAKNVSKEKCLEKADSFIYVSNECIEYRAFEGEDNEHVMIIVHGTWDMGTNTLGRYAPFAETMNLNTDLTTVAIALTGYSNSSMNSFKSLAHKQDGNLSLKKEYIIFLKDLIKSIKKKYDAKTITYIGHSAGATLGASLSALEPELLQNIVLVGGKYKLEKSEENKGNIVFNDLINQANKESKYLFIYGTKDKISKPEHSIEFFEIVKSKKLNAKLIEVKDAEHIDLDMTDTSIEAIVELIEQ